MCFEDIKIGMPVQIAPAVIEKEKMLSFARVYDNIPLHTDEDNQKGILVLTDVTEAIVKCKIGEEL